jgi:hypothetical protein
MSTQVQYRRGTATQNNAFTGALAEITVDTTNLTLRVHDGITAGGYSLVGLAASQTLTNKIYQGTSVSVTGNVTGGNLITGGLISATGNITGGNLLGNGRALTSLSASNLDTGTLDQTRLANANVVLGSTALTLGTTTTTIAGLTSVTSTTFVGDLTGAATTAGTVTTAAQPNVTSVGILTSVSVTGNVTGGNLSTAGTVSATGNIVGGNLSGTSIVGTLTTAAQTNITSVGTLSALSVTGNVTGGNLITAGAVSGNGRALTSLNASNLDTGTLDQTRLANAAVTLGSTALTLGATVTTVAGLTSVTSTTFVGDLTGAATTAGTVTTAAQPNITSVGTLTSVSITGNTTSGNFTTAGLVNTGTLQTSGNAIVGGNLIVNGNTISVNVTNLNVQDPIIGLGRGANNAPLTTNDGKDRGTEMWYYDTAERAAFVGYDNSSGKLIAAANVSITDEIVTVNNYGSFVVGAVEAASASVTGNVTAGNFVGTLNGSGANVTSISATNISAGTLAQARLANANVVLGSTTLALGTTTTTIAGLTSVTSTTFVGDLTGAATSATTAGTVTTAAQPNITSVGTLSSLAVTGNTTSGNFVGTLNGSGANVTSISATNISAGTLAQARLANAAVTLGSTALTLGATVTTVAGLTSVTSTTFVGALTGAATSATTAGTVTTAAQPNITSVGTLSALSVTGNITGGNLITAGLASLSSITKTGTNGVGNIGATGSTFNTVFAKATSAQYADVAEQYQADADYPPGTVLSFGGTQEVTASTASHDTAVAGVVSQRPSYLMNAGLQTANSVPVALLGRVPCQVVGTITRGQLLVTSSTPGTATALDHTRYVPGCVIGKALEDYNSNVAGMIEIAVGIK